MNDALSDFWNWWNSNTFLFPEGLTKLQQTLFPYNFLRDLQFLGCKIMKGIETIKIIVVFYVNNADDFFTSV